MTETVPLSEELETAVVELFALLTRTAPGDLSRTSASVLRAVAEQPRRVTELAALQAVAQPTMTVLVGRLEARGYVERTPDPSDRRASLVAATTAGRAAVEARRANRARVLAERLDGLAGAERDALAAALPALRNLSSGAQP